MGNRNALRHGLFSAAWIEERRDLANLVREAREMAAALRAD